MDDKDLTIGGGGRWSDDSLSKSSTESKQLDLFQGFLTNTELDIDMLSNAVFFWDAVPRYSVSALAMNKMRTADGFLSKKVLDFKYRGQQYQAVVSPALINENDRQVAYYPSANEELVEEALRKIASEQYTAYFDNDRQKFGVYFSISKLVAELKKHGHTRSHSQIFRSLCILKEAHIEIRRMNGSKFDGIYSSNYLPLCVAVSDKSVADKSATWMAQFHPIVASALENINYCQFNYHRLMSHETQLERWLNKQICINFRQASPMNSFEMKYSTIKRDSNLLSYSRERDSLKAVDKAFNGLVKKELLSNVQRIAEKGRAGKILDVTYRFWPTKSFVKEMKASNKRLKDSKTYVGLARG